jgi:hypothetical protein
MGMRPKLLADVYELLPVLPGRQERVD